jgi:hypothetical protein
MKDQGTKLTVIKTLRLSEALLKMITTECKTRELEFSVFMRSAALAAITHHHVRVGAEQVVLRTLDAERTA